MSVRRNVLLFLLAFAVFAGVSAFQSAPGYMDADYYYLGGWQLATGRGFTEPVLWNYLDDPSGIPHPSHAYWMPLTSLVAWVSLAFGEASGVPLDSFSPSRWGFLVLAALGPPLSASLADRLTRDRTLPVLSGMLAIFSGFYLPFLPTSDTFAVYLVLGALFLWVVVDGASRPGRYLLLGAIAGLMHLARADGVVWVGLAGLAAWGPGWLFLYRRGRPSARERVGGLLLVAVGYGVVMGPWLARNLMAFGSPLSPGGAKTLWMTGYDELFSYPSDLLTPRRWWAAGLTAALNARAWALGLNLQTAFAVQGVILLTPLIALGLWERRHDPRARVGVLAWVVTFVVMTFVFPFPGARGGFFHSGVAVQPLFWAVAPLGLARVNRWGARRRGWDPTRATRMFGWGLVGLALLLSALIVATRVLGVGSESGNWNESAATYRRLDRALQARGAEAGDRVMVNNPPGYFVVTGREALVIPDGGPETTLAAARQFGARFLLLESNHVRGLNGLYEDPEDRPGLEYLGSVEASRLFRIE